MFALILIFIEPLDFIAPPLPLNVISFSVARATKNKLLTNKIINIIFKIVL